MWLMSCCEYMCMHMGVKTSWVSNTPWGCLWGVTSLWESWNVIWGYWGLAALGIQSCGSLVKGSTVSILGHVSGIRNLDLPDPQASCQILLEGEGGKDTSPCRFTSQRNVRRKRVERKTDSIATERNRSTWNGREAHRNASRAWLCVTEVCD